MNDEFDQHKNDPLLDPFGNPASQSHGGSGYSFQVSYELLFWVIFLLITLFCILDRFTTKLLLLKIKFPALDQTNQPGPIPAAMAFFDMFGRITGRMFLTVLNALFWTQCKTIENLIMEKTAKWRWIHVGDIRTTHNKIHYILGVFFMLIPMIIHCYAIFLPVIFGNSAIGLTAQPGSQNVTPFIDTGGNIIVSTDNIFRLVMVAIVFGIVFPVSMANYTRIKYFSGTQWLHLFGAFIFSIDMLRRAPHAQIFSSPMLIIYVIDRIVGLFFYRTGEATIIHHLDLDDNYSIVFFYIPNQKRQRDIGSVYYLGFKPGESQLEITHPYACFQNHTDEPLKEGWKNFKDASSDSHSYSVKGKQLTSRESDIELEDNRGRAETTETEDQVFFSNWNTAAVVQIHRTRNNRSWSKRISQKSAGERIRFFGPYNSEYSNLTPDGRQLPPLILAGTGGGAPFLLDFYFHFVANKTVLRNRVDVYFSCDSVGLFQFVTDACAEREIENWNFNAHLTKHDDLDNRGTQRSTKRGTGRNVALGRASFDEVISQASKDTEVYFCGNAHLQTKMEICARRYGLKFYPGHRFNAEGPGILCEKISTCNYVTRCNKFPCALCY